MAKSNRYPKDTPEIASAKTYYACRKKIAELFRIEPQAGGSPRASFEATILHLRAFIESGALSVGANIKKRQERNQPSLGLEHFSQEHIVGALMRARDKLLNGGISTVKRRELIAAARDVMVKDYGLKRTILKPSASSGVYSELDAQMQKFLRRLGPQVKSFGSGPDDIIALVRFSWQDHLSHWYDDNRQSISTCGFMLSHYGELCDWFGSNALWLGIDRTSELSLKVKRSRLAEQLHFLKRYFENFINEHDGDLPDGSHGGMVFRVLHRFRPEHAESGYGIFIANSNELLAPAGNSDFRGTSTNLFLHCYDEICFSCIMNTMPFDVAIIRNKNGEDWNEKGASKALQAINHDLRQHVIPLVPDHPDSKKGDHGVERGMGGAHSGFIQEFCDGPFLGIRARLSFYSDKHDG